MNYEPTPGQIAGIKQAEAERTEIVQRIMKRIADINAKTVKENRESYLQFLKKKK